ncbi:MAG TPA: class II aldolase/adducin family protein [Candidatus Acidoferrum sp.]|nr:class II aldolase/adducin family protein [Candidatus Acidoferrum sp.]
MNATLDSDPEFQALLDLSARIGADAALVQGPGGNTSLKRDGVMWIKASGAWLAQARERPIMVPVRLAPLLAALAEGDPACESAVGLVPADLNPQGLRPSIETTMHAALPQRVVLHVHCVETIAWAVQADAQERLAALLDGLDWILVPYVRPGPPLTQLMETLVSARTTVVVLANHGLVVCGESVAAAAETLREVVLRLKRPVRPAPEPDLALLSLLCGDRGYRLPRLPAVHAIATDPESLEVARRGSLYPDHIVFLGRGVFALGERETLGDGLRRAQAEGRGEPALVLVPGKGALVRTAAPPAAEAIAGCLGDVLQRLRADEPIRVLGADEEDAIANWDAELYRKALARRPA